MGELQELYKKVRQGDVDQEAVFFDKLLVRFRVLAKQRLQEEYAEDIAQEACMTVIEKYKELPEDTPFEPWAYKVLRNKIGSYLRDSKVRRTRILYTDNIESAASAESTESDLVLKQKINSCLKKLSNSNKTYMTVMEMKYKGYSTAEICQKLDIKPNNLYVLLHRCRSLLYDCIYKDKDIS